MIKHTGTQSKKANDFEKLVRRFRGLGFSEEELAPELELPGYARKYITGFPEWQKWTRQAIRNLLRARAYYRKKA